MHPLVVKLIFAPVVFAVNNVAYIEFPDGLVLSMINAAALLLVQPPPETATYRYNQGRRYNLELVS